MLVFLMVAGCWVILLRLTRILDTHFESSPDKSAPTPTSAVLDEWYDVPQALIDQVLGRHRVLPAKSSVHSMLSLEDQRSLATAGSPTNTEIACSEHTNLQAATWEAWRPQYFRGTNAREIRFELLRELPGGCHHSGGKHPACFDCRMGQANVHGSLHVMRDATTMIEARTGNTAAGIKCDPQSFGSANSVYVNLPKLLDQAFAVTLLLKHDLKTQLAKNREHEQLDLPTSLHVYPERWMPFAQQAWDDVLVPESELIIIVFLQYTPPPTPSYSIP